MTDQIEVAGIEAVREVWRELNRRRPIDQRKSDHNFEADAPFLGAVKTATPAMSLVGNDFAPGSGKVSPLIEGTTSWGASSEELDFLNFGLNALAVNEVVSVQREANTGLLYVVSSSSGSGGNGQPTACANVEGGEMPGTIPTTISGITGAGSIAGHLNQLHNLDTSYEIAPCSRRSVVFVTHAHSTDNTVTHARIELVVIAQSVVTSERWQVVAEIKYGQGTDQTGFTDVPGLTETYQWFGATSANGAPINSPYTLSAAGSNPNGEISTGGTTIELWQ